MKNDARVEAVVSNHMEASLRKTALVLQHAVKVLQRGGVEGNRSASDNRRSGVREREGWCALATYHTKPWVDP